MYWTYFFELGVYQIIVGIFASKIFNSKGRTGAITAVLFSGPITLLSYSLDEKFHFNSYRIFGITGIIIGILLLVLIANKNRK